MSYKKSLIYKMNSFEPSTDPWNASDERTGILPLLQTVLFKITFETPRSDQENRFKSSFNLNWNSDYRISFYHHLIIIDHMFVL